MLVCVGQEASACVGCVFSLALEDLDCPVAVTAESFPSHKPSCGTLGAYELLEEIGRGGMGIIYKARRANTHDVRAVKVLGPLREAAIESRARFERETQAMASLHHPHVMPIHEVCLEGETPFFSMDFAPGGTLADVMPKYCGRWRQIAELIGQVSKAVHCAHEHGLLHRDLKPGNILFTEDFQPLVSDFGLAKWLDDSRVDLTRPLEMFGTPSYVAPEQAAGKNRELTPAADVYSLGAIFYELLTGRPPFVGKTALAVLQQALTDVPQRVRSLIPGAPKGLETICMRCLARNPGDRYPAAQDLADDLDHWLLGRKIHACGRPWQSQLLATIRTPAQRAAVIIAFTMMALTACIIFKFLTSPKPKRSGNLLFPPLKIRIEDFVQDESFEPKSEQLAATFRQVFGGGVQNDAFSVHRITSRELHRKTGSLPDNQLKITSRAAESVALQECLRVVDSKLRIVSRLVQTSTGDTMWMHVDSLPAHASEDEIVSTLTKIRSEVTNQTNAANVPPDSERTSPTLNSEAAAYYKKALELYSRGTANENDNAISLYENVLRLEPTYVPALAGLANAYRMKCDWWNGGPRCLETAERFARQAVKLNSFSAEAHHSLGGCYVAQKRYRDALEEFLLALEINPESAPTYSFVGTCWRELGFPQKALPWMIRAAQLDPVHGTFDVAVGQTAMLASADEQAEVALKRGLEIDPDQPHALSSLSVLYLWQKNWMDARKFSTDLSRRFSDYPFERELAAEVSFFSNEDSDALARYQDLVLKDSFAKSYEYFGAISPSSAVACLLLKKGNRAEAEQMLAKAQKTDEQLLGAHPNNCRILHDLAAVYTLKGDTSMGMEFLKLAVAAGWVEQRSTLIDPRFSRLNADHEFIEMIARTPPRSASR